MQIFVGITPSSEVAFDWYQNRDTDRRNGRVVCVISPNLVLFGGLLRKSG